MKTSEICKECSQQSDCCFIDNGLQHRCGVVSAYKRGFEDGIGHGWHPASVPPVVPEHYNWISVVAIVLDMDDNSTRATNATFNKDKGWIFPEFSRVLYWCYRPKED